METAMEPNETQSEEKNLFEDNPYHLVQASIGKRLGNYLMDILVFSVLLFIAMMVTSVWNPQLVESFVKKSETGFTFPEQLLLQAIYGVYLSITEALFKGKTLGKVITGTRAVNMEGSPVQLKDTLLRGLIRMIPFEQFTALGKPSYPLHDRLSKTYVIDEKLSRYPG